MNMSYAEFTVRIPPYSGDPPIQPTITPFDYNSARKKACTLLGLSDELTDEELKEIKIEFGLSFIKDNVFASGTAYQAVLDEIRMLKDSNDEFVESIFLLYEKKLEEYETGHDYTMSVTLSLDENVRESQIEAIKNRPDLVGEVKIKNSLPFIRQVELLSNRSLSSLTYEGKVFLGLKEDFEDLIKRFREDSGIDLSDKVSISESDYSESNFFSIEDLSQLLYGSVDNQIYVDSLIDRIEVSQQSSHDNSSKQFRFTEPPSEEDIFSKLNNLI